MVTMKMSDPNLTIGCYIQGIYSDNFTRDPQLISIKSRANKAIEQYSSKENTVDNCQKLQEFLKVLKAQLVVCKDSEAKFDVMNQLTNIIDNLQTGIDRVPSHTNNSYTPEKKDDKYKGWKCFSEQYQIAMAQYKVNGYRNIPIVWDKTKLEGYMRSVPNVIGMDVFEFFKKYFYDHLLNFVRPTPQECRVISNGGSSEKYVDRAAQICAKSFAFVQLTSTKQNVIIDLSDTDDDED